MTSAMRVGLLLWERVPSSATDRWTCFANLHHDLVFDLPPLQAPPVLLPLQLVAEGWLKPFFVAVSF